jgi:hypothetical protein
MALTTLIREPRSKRPYRKPALQTEQVQQMSLLTASPCTDSSQCAIGYICQIPPGTCVPDE